MAKGKADLYALGQGGVNVVLNPLQLKRDQATQLQNCIFPTASGEGGLGKRGGLPRFNAAALNAGASVLAATNVPLPNPFNTSTLVRKYLYAGHNDEWYRSSDGTTWVAQGSALNSPGEFSAAGIPVLGLTPLQPVPGKLLYINGNLSHDDFRIYDGTSDQLVLVVPPASGSSAAYSAGASGFHLGKFYFGTISSSSPGRVHELDLVTGQLRMVVGVIGSSYDAYSIVSYLGQLFVGASDFAATPNSFIYRCDPATATAWTVDSAALDGVPVSMVNFKGNLYIGCGSNNAAVPMRVYKRTPSGVYSIVLTDASPWNFMCGGQLAVFNDTIFAYQAGVIWRSTNGTAWVSDLDVYTTYLSYVGVPGRPVVFGGALYWPFRYDDTALFNGMILKRTTGAVWSKVLEAEELNGLITVFEVP